MFRKYGIIGILLVVLVKVTFFFKIEPFASFYFPIIWLGYILIVDALIYKIRHNSLISNRFSQFLGMVLISMLFWWIFEFVNLGIRNWGYITTSASSPFTNSMAFTTLFASLSFATVLPAFFETVELIKSVH